MVVREFDVDNQSCEDWYKINKSAMKMAMQYKEEKNFPWPKASNIKYPLITTAALQFAARAGPEMINSPDIVKAKIIGAHSKEKVARAERISRFMSYQLMEEMPMWEEEMDKLFHILPIIGCLLKKTYRDCME